MKNKAENLFILILTVILAIPAITAPSTVDAATSSQVTKATKLEKLGTITSKGASKNVPILIIKEFDGDLEYKSFFNVTFQLKSNNGIDYYKINNTKYSGKKKKEIFISNLTTASKSACEGYNTIYVYDIYGNVGSYGFYLVKKEPGIPDSNFDPIDDNDDSDDDIDYDDTEEISAPIIIIREGSSYTKPINKKKKNYRKISFQLKSIGESKVYAYKVNGKYTKLKSKKNSLYVNNISIGKNSGQKGKNVIRVYAVSNNGKAYNEGSYSFNLVK